MAADRLHQSVFGYLQTRHYLAAGRVGRAAISVLIGHAVAVDRHYLVELRGNDGAFGVEHGGSYDAGEHRIVREILFEIMIIVQVNVQRAYLGLIVLHLLE